MSGFDLSLFEDAMLCRRTKYNLTDEIESEGARTREQRRVYFCILST